MPADEKLIRFRDKLDEVIEYISAIDVNEEFEVKDARHSR